MVAEAPVLPSGSGAAELLPQPEVAPLVSSQRPYQVAIAGGGIGGLCTALVLLNLGYEVCCQPRPSVRTPERSCRIMPIIGSRVEERIG
jgi:hypothetical protein